MDGITRDPGDMWLPDGWILKVDMVEIVKYEIAIGHHGGVLWYDEEWTCND